MFNMILDFLLPAECMLCESPLSGGQRYICASCRAGLPRTGYHLRAENPMTLRVPPTVPYERIAGFLFYTHESPAALLIHDFKYRGISSLARTMGRMMGEELAASEFMEGVDWIMPVPLHWSKLMRRGYNQSLELARGVSAATGIAVSPDLKAIRPHATQTSKSTEERRRNTLGIFRLAHPERYAGCKILIIDDVCTTGSTILSAAEAVYEGVKALGLTPPRISMLTLATTS